MPSLETTANKFANLKKYWWVILILLIIFLGLIVAFLFATKPKTQTASQDSKNSASSSVTTENTQQEPVDTNAPNLKLKSIGVNLDYYDAATNKAGDFLFTKKKLQFNRVFMPYGFVIPGNSTTSGKDKANPQPTFVVPSGTKVLALVDGVVARIEKVWSGDYSVMVSSDGQMQKWMFETEHVLNPVVKVGDKVKAGQVVAEVSDFDKSVPAGYGTVKIGILNGGGSQPEHVCPFLYLDPSVKQQITTKLQDLMKNWETYVGDASLYDETLATPGCITTDPIPG